MQPFIATAPTVRAGALKVANPGSRAGIRALHAGAAIAAGPWAQRCQSWWASLISAGVISTFPTIPTVRLPNYLLEGRLAACLRCLPRRDPRLRPRIDRRRGYNGFSYADIAAVVGIRKASIHHHFPTKVDLVRTLVQRYRAEAEAGMAESLRTVADPVARLHGYTDYWAACIGVPDTSYCLCALLATQIPVLPDEVATEVRAYFRSLSDWLTAALETGAAQDLLLHGLTTRRG